MKKTLLAIAAILALMFVYAYGYAIGKLSVSDRGRFVLLPASDNDTTFWHGELALDTLTGQICRTGTFEVLVDAYGKKGIDVGTFPECRELAKR